MAGIDDVLVAGFTEVSEKPLRFHHLFWAVFFEFGGELLKFAAIGDSGRMSIERTERVWYDSLDDDLEPASASIRQIVLDNSDGTGRLASAQLWDFQMSQTGIECAAVRFELANGQIVFLDPTYHFGIRVGGASQEAIFAENSGGRKGLRPNYAIA